MSAYDRIRDRLTAGQSVVVGGPMGAELVRRGVRWRGHGMLTDADAVLALYRDYVAAGPDVIRTNTFQLNHRIYLDVFRDKAHMAHIGAPGLATRATELTRKAVQLARQARDDAGPSDIAIAGVVGPLEHVFRPDLAPEETVAHEEHKELIGIMAEAGVDMILLEGMNTLAEARVAAAAAIGAGLPFWASFALGPDGLLLGGDILAGAARAMRDQGAGAVLVNALPPGDVTAALPSLTAGGPGGAMPMVGRYDPPSWKFEFFPQFCQVDTYSPEALVADAERWVAAGARVVGADGGAGPDHTRALVGRFGAGR